jgi:hypothetical protein
MSAPLNPIEAAFATNGMVLAENYDRSAGLSNGKKHNNTGRFRSCAESSNHGQLANSPACAGRGEQPI